MDEKTTQKQRVTEVLAEMNDNLVLLEDAAIHAYDYICTRLDSVMENMPDRTPESRRAFAQGLISLAGDILDPKYGIEEDGEDEN